MVAERFTLFVVGLFT